MAVSQQIMTAFAAIHCFSMIDKRLRQIHFYFNCLNYLVTFAYVMRDDIAPYIAEMVEFFIL